MAKKDSSDKKVTRITASDKAAPRTKRSSAAKKPAKKDIEAADDTKRSIAGGFFGYFKGAWVELRQVHWPTRRATWGLTGAVLAFSGFFVGFILLLDALFKYVFETILK